MTSKTQIPIAEPDKTKFSSPNDFQQFFLKKAGKDYASIEKQMKLAIAERKRLLAIVEMLRDEGWIVYEVAENIIKELGDRAAILAGAERIGDKISNK